MIITKSIPPYRFTLRNLLFDRGGGRQNTLSNAQIAFKSAWTRLSAAPINGKYNTRLAQWTCDCGSQKYHANLLCKHLVQAAGTMKTTWWNTVIRHHKPPFYIVPIEGVMADPPEDDSERPWLDDSDAEVDEMLDSATTSIQSSPSKAPPTGRDGLMRTRAGNGAGFEVRTIIR